MGWNGVYQKVTNPSKFVTDDYNYENDKIVSSVLMTRMVGTTVYAAIRVVVKGERVDTYKCWKTDDKNAFVYGAVVLTKRSKGEFLWKDMSEDAGPYYWDCPAKILGLLSEIVTDEYGGEHAKKWRDGCRNQKKLVAAAIPEGATVKFKKPITFSGVPADEFKRTTLYRRNRKMNVYWNQKIGYCRINLKNYAPEDYTVTV
jgi:hypothetical protein